MAGQLTSLHTALDLHQLDPKAKEDRPYLVSLLRRMGYTEIEIQHIVTGKKTIEQVDEERAEDIVPTPEPDPEPEPEATVTVEDSNAPRLIELEYGGSENVPEFQPVRRKDHQPVKSEPVKTTEFEVVSNEEPVEDIANEFVLLEPEEETLVEFTEVVPAIEVEDAEPLVEFSETAPAWEDAPQDDIDDWGEAEWDEPESDGHQYNGFTLYRRELPGGQHVYFFSKKTPADAEPSEKPDGYEVAEAEDTGLPYLRPMGVNEPTGEKKPAKQRKSRHGITAVEADSEEEAREIATRRGLHVEDVVEVELDEEV